jgi:antitoxin CptB
MNTKILEDAEIRWQCRRGMLELDILLLSFFDKKYAELSLDAKQDFCDLLTCSDQALYEWLVKRTTSNIPRLEMLLTAIRQSTWKE